MKKIQVLSLLLASAITAGAQHTSFLKNETGFQKQFHNHVREMLNKQNSQPLQKTTAMQERVIAESRYDYSSTPAYMTDSIALQYSGNNGSKFNYDNMNYGYYYGMQITPAYYPYQLNKTDVMADTLRLFSKASAANTTTLDEIMSFNFNTNNDVAKFGEYYFTSGAADGADVILNTYNTQGRLATFLALSDDGSGSLDSVGKIIFYYDAQGRNSIDSIFDYDLGDWTPSALLAYTYDANSNITQLRVDADNNFGTWVTAVQYDHTFYPNNKLQTVIGSQYSGGILVPAVKDSFEYTGSAPFYTSLTEYGYGSGWIPSVKLTKSLNAQNLPDTFYVYGTYNATTSQFELTNKIKYTYSSYNNPAQATQLDNDGTGNYTLSGIVYYYYETFNNTNSVKTLTTKADIQLYPNPATDALHLQWKEGNGKQAIAQITNASGQLMMTKRLSWNGDAVSLPVNVLSAGLYFVTVRDESGAAIFAGQFIKG